MVFKSIAERDKQIVCFSHTPHDSRSMVFVLNVHVVGLVASHTAKEAHGRSVFWIIKLSFEISCRASLIGWLFQFLIQCQLGICFWNRVQQKSLNMSVKWVGLTIGSHIETRARLSKKHSNIKLTVVVCTRGCLVVWLRLKNMFTRGVNNNHCQLWDFFSRSTIFEAQIWGKLSEVKQETTRRQKVAEWEADFSKVYEWKFLSHAALYTSGWFKKYFN